MKVQRACLLSAGLVVLTFRAAAAADWRYVGLPEISRLGGEPPAAPGAPAQARRFHYDSKTGVCEDENGRQGFNDLRLDELQSTKDGECADLQGLRLNGDDMHYPQLIGWNLRGADLRKATLYFAMLLDADLRGARMDGFAFGYAHITGTVDSFTKAPSRQGPGPEACRVKEGTKLECWN